ncbi:hypothetical protein Ait01nite_061100 [Actinoplanes italicus]|uniref:Uncharacterized protein n=1 Tax=Actinoplanes italicus TaxID=113567 RepID=A0A2T0K7C7_9ACTN|nr:hypothetical protein [Actinoplanes italicus]PRX18724.1 hypothetical protein CLV67_112199 [Actinoplanes italicus]GIE33065.1 hypothetical protein Ait01nite_061100 [Actinoplanes italicus]
MITVAQPAARPWDGQRILRFLTGLAMLALAVTLRLPAPAVPAAAPAPVAPVSAAAAAVVSAPDPEVYETERIDAAPVAEPVVAPATVRFTTRIPDGGTLGTTGSRAPPAA